MKWTARQPMCDDCSYIVICTGMPCWKQSWESWYAVVMTAGPAPHDRDIPLVRRQRLRLVHARPLYSP